MNSTAVGCADPGHPSPLRDRYFSFARVDGTAELETTYRVRYQVYCIERGFLPAADYPDGLEADAYDAHSVHILATHCAGEPAGTARLVMSSPLGFPLLRHCAFGDEFAYLNDPSYPGLAHYAEISRLAISKSFRRRVGDTLYGGLPREESEPLSHGEVVPLPVPRRSPEILVGLCRMLYQESKRHRITHWLLAMERSLYLMLKRMGFRFFPAGPDVDYYGPVRPYVTSIVEFESWLYETFPETLHYFVHGLEPELVPAYVRDAEPQRLTCASVA